MNEANKFIKKDLITVFSLTMIILAIFIGLYIFDRKTNQLEYFASTIYHSIIK